MDSITRLARAYNIITLPAAGHSVEELIRRLYTAQTLF